MKSAVNEPRIVQLRELLETLAAAIDAKPGARDLAQLSKQYRETLREIEEIEELEEDNDEIAEILSERKTAGKAGPVR